ncbi:recombinase family protein [Sphingomonas sp. RHCKR47]|uniref:recombinase family protein n=1 Tax=Sphingomonas citricola TaxID=2862498 RepID=UPI001C66A6DA|nr:recombinase family protein [Sphingomonas citricola]MBW6525157.1 recombinase family protein [Sphingomonas citricola]
MSTRVRCAIYTRKSSEEGLEQSFNSLDAQREACGAYILSQASEGWVEIADTYDDGGLSGGTLERPALQRLLADVASGRIDIIVVYKVDRLTRSLLDFAKLVEAFDAAGTSFVSVTQSFNTTSSMGRLTLNMLLSFAQFEREVTAERIRDKIAASKARGMWMGGVPPLGYAPDGRSLRIVEEHATLTRHVFERYLALGNVRALAEELARERRYAPLRTLTSGKQVGGRAFSRGQLYLMLRCVTYTGQIGHHGKIYPGQHVAIIASTTFDAVQALLSVRAHQRRARTNMRDTSLLAGKLRDADDEPLIASHATTNNRRYRYYVSRALHHGDATTGLRIPAREIEQLVTHHVAQLFADPIELAATAWLDLSAGSLATIEEHARVMYAELQRRHAPALVDLVDTVRIIDTGVEISLSTSAIAASMHASRHADAPDTIMLSVPASITRSGRVLRLVHDSSAQQAPDRALVRVLVQARGWWAELRRGEISAAQLAANEGVTPSYLTRILRLAFLAPAVTDAILKGRQRRGVTVKTLTLEGALPVRWSEQQAMLIGT